MLLRGLVHGNMAACLQCAFYAAREATIKGTCGACNDCGIAPYAPFVVSSYTGRGPFITHLAVRMKKTRKGSKFGTDTDNADIWHGVPRLATLSPMSFICNGVRGLLRLNGAMEHLPADIHMVGDMVRNRAVRTAATSCEIGVEVGEV